MVWRTALPRLRERRRHLCGVGARSGEPGRVTKPPEPPPLASSCLIRMGCLASPFLRHEPHTKLVWRTALPGLEGAEIDAMGAGGHPGCGNTFMTPHQPPRWQLGFEELRMGCLASPFFSQEPHKIGLGGRHFPRLRERRRHLCGVGVRSAGPRRVIKPPEAPPCPIRSTSRECRPQRGR